MRAVISAALLAVGLFGLPKFSLDKPSQSLVSVAEPSTEMKSAVSSVVKAVRGMSISDRLWLQYIYLNCSKVVKADGIVDVPVVVTTEGLRAIHRAVLKFIWKGMADNAAGKYEGLSKAIDDAFVSVIGDEQKPLTDELRAEAVELFDAIAWAGLGKDQ